MFPGLCIPNTICPTVLYFFPFLPNGQSLSLFPFSSLIRVILLPCFLRKFRMMGLSGIKKFFSPTTSPLPYSLLGTRGCLSGDWDLGEDSRIGVSFFNQGGRVKSSQGGEKIINRKHKQYSHQYITYYSNSFPMLSLIKYDPFANINNTIQSNLSCYGFSGRGVPSYFITLKIILRTHLLPCILFLNSLFFFMSML
jgi:hypothetical protein